MLRIEIRISIRRFLQCKEIAVLSPVHHLDLIQMSRLFKVISSKQSAHLFPVFDLFSLLRYSNQQDLVRC